MSTLCGASAKAIPRSLASNIGIDSGEAAGQTVPHCHVHLILWRLGDVENARGGVRGVVPGKQHDGS
jgi:diadenosine tetraphosphate (Ap4A) HIT family hydrolase